MRGVSNGVALVRVYINSVRICHVRVVKQVSIHRFTYERIHELFYAERERKHFLNVPTVC